MSTQLPGAEFPENMSIEKLFCLNTGLCQLMFGVFLKYPPHKTTIISFKYHWKEDISSTNII